jgi:hypothetical protein
MALSPIEVMAWQLYFYHRAVNPSSILFSKLISGQAKINIDFDRTGYIIHINLPESAPPDCSADQISPTSSVLRPDLSDGRYSLYLTTFYRLPESSPADGPLFHHLSDPR